MATVDHAALVTMLDRLKLSAIRDQLDTLLDEAARLEMSLREALAFRAGREIARRDERRIDMPSKIAQFPFVRELDDFDFEAQPSLDPRQLRELAAGRRIAHGIRCGSSASSRDRQDASGGGARARGDPAELQRPVRHGGDVDGDAGEGARRWHAGQTADDPVAPEAADH